MTQIQATVYCSIRTELKPIFSGHPVQCKSEKQPAKRCPCFCVLPEPEQKANIMPEQYIQQERGVFTPPQAVVVFAEFTSFHYSLSPCSVFYQAVPHAPEAAKHYEAALSWMTYRSVYSSCKELLKFDLSAKQRRQEIRKI